MLSRIPASDGPGGTKLPFGVPPALRAPEAPLRRIRYLVAASLDGYIAGPEGEADWIVPDPEFDSSALFGQFDTVLLGRRTYEITRTPGAPAWPAGIRVYVFSRTLRPGDHPGVTVVAERVEETLAALRAMPGKDIWLFGGGSLFRSLLEARMVDTVEVAVMPVLLGGDPAAPAAGGADEAQADRFQGVAERIGLAGIRGGACCRRRETRMNIGRLRTRKS